MSSGAPVSEHSAGDMAQTTSTNPSHCTVKDIQTEADFAHHTTSLAPTTLAVIYFHASWAEPCKQMSTVLSVLASTYKTSTPPTISFVSVDAEEISDVSERFDVTQVPYLVLQRDNKILETISGSDAARIRAAVEKYAGAGDANPGKLGLPPPQVVRKPASTTGAASGARSPAGYTPSGGDLATAPGYSSGQNEVAKEELNTRLGELVKAAPVMVFMKGTPSAPQCGFSRQTVSILREKGIRYGFFNILADDEVRQGLKEFSDWPTFPQVYVGGELVGGLDILKEEFENDADFLLDYSVSKQRSTGGTAGTESQTAPA